MLRKYLIGSLSFILLLAGLASPAVHAESSSTKNNTTDRLNLGAKAAISFDAASGKIFYEKNAETPLPIASTTKLLTMYLILEAIHDGQLSWDDEIKISEHLAELSRNMDLSNVILQAGESYRVKDLFIATEKVSANAAVIALSEKIAGSEKEFVDLMRSKLKEWDINDAYIISTSGLNNEDTLGQIYPGSKENEENLMSAKDLGIVAFHLLNDFPEILEFSAQSEAVFAPNSSSHQNLLSTNEMLPHTPFYLAGVDGLKTGTTKLAGTCFVGTIKQDDRRVITVVLHSETMDERFNGQRFKDTASLMSDALENWEKIPYYSKGALTGKLSKTPVANGLTSDVSLALHDDVNVWVNKLQPVKEEVSLTLEPSLLNKDAQLKAPIDMEQRVGTLNVKLSQESGHFLLDDITTLSVPVYASQAVEKAPWYTLAKRWLTQLFD